MRWGVVHVRSDTDQCREWSQSRLQRETWQPLDSGLHLSVWLSAPLCRCHPAAAGRDHPALRDESTVLSPEWKQHQHKNDLLKIQKRLMQEDIYCCYYSLQWYSHSNKKYNTTTTINNNNNNNNNVHKSVEKLMQMLCSSVYCCHDTWISYFDTISWIVLIFYNTGKYWHNIGGITFTILASGLYF